MMSVLLVERDFQQKCDQCENPFVGHHLNALFMLITMVQFPALYLIHILRYNATFLGR